MVTATGAQEDARRDHVGGGDDARPKDRVRVIVVGAFCEQPPLGLIKTIERAGCYIVDDDFLLGNRILMADVPETGDPLSALSDTSLRHAMPSSILYEHAPEGKKRLIPQRVAEARADGPGLKRTPGATTLGGGDRHRGSRGRPARPRRGW